MAAGVTGGAGGGVAVPLRGARRLAARVRGGPRGGAAAGRGAAGPGRGAGAPRRVLSGGAGRYAVL